MKKFNRELVMRAPGAIKNRIIYAFLIIKDKVVKLLIKAPAVKSIDETIDKIIRDGCSVCRYGDGEVKIMRGIDIGFQMADERLAARLKQVLINADRSIMVCLPDVFSSLDRFTDAARSYWRYYLLTTRLDWYRLTCSNKIYYNAFITRLYLDVQDKTRCAGWFNKLKQVWCDRDIVIVEGYKSRLGYGNDLFENAKSVVRILAPAENAFAKYEDIVKAVKQQDRSRLILLALGPTATVLAYDLHKEGYQAIDIGHVDLEYEWFLRKSNHKIKIPYKYVNEVQGGRQVEDVNDADYLQEIVGVI